MTTGNTALSDRDRAILDFEKAWWHFAGAKEQEIRDRFDLSPTRYYQILNGLIDHPAAEVYDAMLVKRLRRLRAARASGQGRRAPDVAMPATRAGTPAL